MLYKTVQAPGKEKLPEHAEADVQVEDDGNDEIEVTRNDDGGEHPDRMVDKFSSTRMGQKLMEKVDRTLRAIETTAKWGMPQHDVPNLELERPLPWFVFLLLIVCLRVVRTVSSICYYTMGTQPSTARSMVYYLQTKRRRLRALRIQGLKTIRNREVEATARKNSNKSPKLMGKLGTLFKSAICKPVLRAELPGRYMPEGDINTVNDISKRSGKRRRDDDDNNLTVSEMLYKFSNENSDSDSDYVPPEGDPDTSTSTASTSTADETEMENKYSDPDAEANKADDDIQDFQEGEETDRKVESNETENNTMELAKQKEENSEPEVPTGTTRKVLIATEKEIKEKQEDIKENGEKNCNSKSKPMEQDQCEIPTPKEKPETNEGTDAAEISHMPLATAELAQENFITTPRTSLNQLAFPRPAENTSKSTPGHESAASEKPLLTTPISTGSHQDFHTIFHPTQNEKVAPNKAQTSTSKPTDNCESATSDTSEPVTSGNQQRNTNPSNNNKHYYYYNSKNRGKIRR